MIVLQNGTENTQYRYITVGFKNKDNRQKLPPLEQRCEFLMKAIKSYFSMETVLDNEKLFDLLAYNFATREMHLLVCTMDEKEVEDFLNFIQIQYKHWTGVEVENEIISNTPVSSSMLLSISARIHTLTKNWMGCREKTSLNCYLYDDTPGWITTRHVKSIYGSAVDYYEFLKLYKQKELLVQLKAVSYA